MGKGVTRAFDASVILEVLTAGPRNQAAAAALRHGGIASAVTRQEVVDHLVRHHGAAPLEVAGDLHMLDVTWLEHDVPLADRSAALRARHYHRRTSPVSLADCATAALALSREATLVTTDGPLAAVVRAEGGEVDVLDGAP